ncbi:MAG: hypothetical protein F9K37_05970 [Bacteroidales bacterium]|nr:MAG: hypothetical protein F9K37_05970 [Bacteroidales bacterium]
MKNFIVLFCLIVILGSLSAQNHQGFSYQAVIRDSDGKILSNQSGTIKASLVSNDSTINYYTEEHSVTSNSFGLVTISIGNGNITSGVFDEVPWGKEQIRLNIQVKLNQATSFTDLGIQALQSVPYALHAANTKEIESSPTATDDEPIFVVRNKEGKIVFAVYQEGVRVYVDDSSAKGAKGGFAVGGLSTQGKAEVEYLKITPDSARIYIDTSSTKGAKGGFAVGGLSTQGKSTAYDIFRVTNDSTRIYIDDRTKGAKGGFAVGGLSTQGKASGVNFFDVSTDATGIINPSQKRVVWYPIKNAFLAGKVLIESPDSVGENSVATGFESKSKGAFSQALGYMAIARGNFSTAIGKRALAHSENSFAFGDGAKAIRNDAFALGSSAQATGIGSYAFGSVGRDTVSLQANTRTTLASGDYSFALGMGAQASESSAFAVGQNSTASNVFAFALGSNAQASGRQASALGALSRATGNFSTALGAGYSTGWYSTAIGYLTQASGSYAVSIGSGYVYSVSGMSFDVYSKAQGSYSLALGNGNNANGSFSSAIGYRNYAYGDQTVTLGSNLAATSYASIVVGSYNYDNTSYSKYFWTLTEPLFVVGNGTYGTPSNAMTILKNGRVGLQTVVAPTYALHLPNSTTTGIGSGMAYAWSTYSDSRVKSDRKPIPYGINEVMRLKPLIYFHHDSKQGSKGIEIEKSGNKSIGLVAQDVFEVIPEVVIKPENEETELWSMSYEKLVPVIIKAMQEQQTIIKSQSKEIQDLKAEVDALKKLISK